MRCMLVGRPEISSRISTPSILEPTLPGACVLYAGVSVIDPNPSLGHGASRVRLCEGEPIKKQATRLYVTNITWDGFPGLKVFEAN
jgi:hypothetical protein